MINFRNVICLDLETCLIRPRLQSPPVVVCSIYHPTTGSKLYGTWELERPVAEWLANPSIIIVGHNIAYDMLCLFEWYPRLRPLIRAAYEADRIVDTGLCQRIVEISTGDLRGQLALDKLCARYGLHVEKHDVDEDGEEVRTGFGKFWGLSAAELPPEHARYAMLDTSECWRLFERIWNKGWATRKDLCKLARTDFCLKAISAFGLRADPEITDKLEAEARATIAKLSNLAIEKGFMRREKNKPEPVRTMRAYQEAVAKAFKIPTKCGEGRNRNKLYPDVDKEQLKALTTMGLVTDTGAVSTGKDVLKESHDPILIMLADLQEWLAVVNKDVPIFRDGVFHTRFGYANTLRTTSSRPNIQNFRRKAGVRECIRAFWGAFVASDYVGLENGTLAQCIVNYTGRRGMADKISSGWDFHCEVGALIMGLPHTKEGYDTFVARLAAEEANGDLADEARVYKLARGAAKPANFGLPGYMSNPSTFMSYARISYGVKMTLERAEHIMNLWWTTQHDQMAYLAFVDGFKDSDDWGSLYSVPIPGTDIIRRGATRTAAANTGFQALGMQTAADALWLITMAQLFGDMPGRACAFVHDEVISDCKPEDIDQCRWLQEKYMIQAAEKNLPDVAMRVETVAMDRWSKKAKHKVDKDGHLILQRVSELMAKKAA